MAMPLIAHGVLVGALSFRFDQQRTFDVGDRALIATMGELCSQALERARLYKAESAARESAESASRSKDDFLAMLSHELRNLLAPIATAVRPARSCGATITRFASARSSSARSRTSAASSTTCSTSLAWPGG